MIEIPMLEEQLANSQFHYEKVCLVLTSQTKYDAMWKRLEKPHNEVLEAFKKLDESGRFTPDESNEIK